MYACMRDDEGKKEGRGKKRYHTLHVFSVFFSVRLRLLRGLEEFGAREHENIILKLFLPFPLPLSKRPGCVGFSGLRVLGSWLSSFAGWICSSSLGALRADGIDRFITLFLSPLHFSILTRLPFVAVTRPKEFLQ